MPDLNSNHEMWFSGVGATVIGFILGSLATYIPQLLSRRSKVASYKSSLYAEIKKCNEMASTYIESNIVAPSYRLPTFAWNNAYPQLLVFGAVNEEQVNVLTQFYIEVDSLNRGLGQANDARYTDGGGNLLTQEHKRNIVKATNITNGFPKALEAIRLVKEWAWL